ncbi:hypothetical protein [Ligilactobacillus equi]|uniref:hypothetical protein n=1 Tax=Ligilactobacillus equi TaxID=137357 RepID=UPI002ED23520
MPKKSGKITTRMQKDFTKIGRKKSILQGVSEVASKYQITEKQARKAMDEWISVQVTARYKDCSPQSMEDERKLARAKRNYAATLRKSMQIKKKISRHHWVW